MPRRLHPLLAKPREQVRRLSYVRFLRTLVPKHPELKRPVTWDGFVAMAHREGITVRVLPLSEPGRLVRCGARVFIQISDEIPRAERTWVGMHELTHFWRDDPGIPVYYASADWRHAAAEDFANVFAWLVTSPHRDIPGTRPEDFE